MRDHLHLYVEGSMRHSLVLYLVAIMTWSCAHSETHQDATKVVDFNPKKTLKIEGEYTQEMVEKAKENGAEASTYLASELYIKAMDASMRGQATTALFFLKFAQDLVPSDSYLAKKYAIELIKTGDLEGALVFLEKQVGSKSSQKDDGIDLLLAGVYAALDKGPKAKVIYEKIIAHGSQFQEACIFLARNLGTEKKYKEGQKALTTCMKKDKAEPLYPYYMGKLLQEEGKKDQAMSYYRKSLKLDPDFFQSILAVGSIYEEKSDFKSALKEYKAYVDLPSASNQYPVLSKIVQIMFAQEMNAEVVSYAERLLSYDDSDLNTKVRLGLLYVDRDEYKKAIGLFKEVLEVVPESDKVLYYLAALYQENGERDLALEYFSKINEASPLFADAILQRAELYSSKAKKEFVAKKVESVELVSFLEKYSAKFDDLKVELNLVKASYLEEIGKTDASVKTLLSVKGHKKFTDGHDYYLASVLEKNGQTEEARNIVKALIKKDPNNAHALNFLGYSFLEKNENLDLAFTYISKAAKLRPQDGFIRDSLAWYFFKVGKYEMALIEANKAYELVNNDVTITKHLGMIYEKLNRFDRASAFYNQALSQTELTIERDEILKRVKLIEKGRKPASLP